jgi:hypothetical protein
VGKPKRRGLRELRVTDRRSHSWFKARIIYLLAIANSLGTAGFAENARAAIPTSPAQDPIRVGKSCVSNDPEYLCLGLKYVVYVDPSSQPVIEAKVVESNLNVINSIWSQCKIGFQVDEFLPKNPQSAGLPTDTSDFSDLDRIRQTFSEESSLLVVTTYPWKRDGNLGHTPANAWTKMPGSGLYGVILEQKVGAFPNIIAHELGHYLNLYHEKENTDVMNAIIYNNSKVIKQEQCATARLSVKKWWSNMIRKLPATSRDPQRLATESVTRTRKS